MFLLSLKTAETTSGTNEAEDGFLPGKEGG